MLTNPGTVWVNGSGTHHQSRSCAGKDAVPTFEEFVAGSDLDACGLCEPDELLQCEKCGERYRQERWLKRHKYQDHIRGSEGGDEDVPEGDDSWRDLNRKARGESDD